MADTPRIITARKIGLTFVNKFGALGPERNVTGHYSAGGRARDAQQLVARAREFHRFHKSKGWGGVGYHFMIGDDGTLVCARPTLLKGTHVGGHNSMNLGVNCPGTTGDKPTAEQKATYQWLLAHAHTNALPRAHRTDLDLRDAKLLVHNMWPGHRTNGCAGAFTPMYLAGVRRIAKKTSEDQLDEPVRRGDTGGYDAAIDLGGIEIDQRHVSEDEAKEAQREARRGEAAEELPGADADFDEDAALQGAEIQSEATATA